MARPRIDATEKAREELRTEIRVKRAKLNLSQKEIGEELGLAPARTSVLLADPDAISIGRLRVIHGILGLDPVVVLNVLGFNQKELRKSVALQQLMGMQQTSM